MDGEERILDGAQHVRGPGGDLILLVGFQGDAHVVGLIPASKTARLSFDARFKEWIHNINLHVAFMQLVNMQSPWKHRPLSRREGRLDQKVIDAKLVARASVCVFLLSGDWQLESFLGRHPTRPRQRL